MRRQSDATEESKTHNEIYEITIMGNIKLKIEIRMDCENCFAHRIAAAHGAGMAAAHAQQFWKLKISMLRVGIHRAMDFNTHFQF
jgi:hypothetical protein